jgi:hypothetical protein
VIVCMHRIMRTDLCFRTHFILTSGGQDTQDFCFVVASRTSPFSGLFIAAGPATLAPTYDINLDVDTDLLTLLPCVLNLLLLKVSSI